MPATFTTEEQFPRGTEEARVRREKELRIAAGAIRSSYEGSFNDGWLLRTEWNVLGQD